MEKLSGHSPERISPSNSTVVVMVLSKESEAEAEETKDRFLREARQGREGSLKEREAPKEDEEKEGDREGKGR